MMLMIKRLRGGRRRPSLLIRHRLGGA